MTILSINNNMMAVNAMRNLSRHYAGLSDSVRRMSSGLRVESAADDAAGLAIRELMRADIAALHQGVRNANDAVSMLQTADGALQVIDEKLIRMKELAEQAATGTYNADQRQMIDEEFQAMKAEIERIALATEFNGVKLLCDDTANKFQRITGYAPGTPDTPPAISSGEVLNPDAVTSDATVTYRPGNPWTLNSLTGDQTFRQWRMTYSWAPGAYMQGVTMILSYNAANQRWTMAASSRNQIRANGIPDPQIFHAMSYDRSVFVGYDPWGNPPTAMSTLAQWTGPRLTSNTSVSMTYNGDFTPTIDSGGAYPNMAYLGGNLWDLDGDGSADIRVPYNSSGGGSFGLTAGIPGSGPQGVTDHVTRVHFGTSNDSAEDYYDLEDRDCTAKGLGIDAFRVWTQDAAQHSLAGLKSAIAEKDAARAYFGAAQNRLENTVSNLQIQAENLQIAESRISDTDVALEMTEFVRNQILASAAISMLTQANSAPRALLTLF